MTPSLIEEFLIALADDDLAEVSRCLNIFGYADFPLDSDGLTPLHCAVSEASQKTITYLINNGCNVNYPTKSGLLPIHYATIRGDLSILQLLHSHGASLSSPTPTNLTPLHLSVQHNHPFITNFLLSHNVSTDVYTSDHGLTPLHLAMYPLPNPDDNLTLARYLLSNRASVNVLDNNGFTPLHTLIQNFKDDQATSALLALLYQYGADLHWSVQVPAPLLMAIDLDKPVIATCLLELDGGLEVSNPNPNPNPNPNSSPSSRRSSISSTKPSPKFKSCRSASVTSSDKKSSPIKSTIDTNLSSSFNHHLSRSRSKISPLAYAIDKSKWTCVSILSSSLSFSCQETTVDTCHYLFSVIDELPIFHKMIDEDIDIDLFLTIASKFEPIIDCFFDYPGYSSTPLLHAVCNSTSVKIVQILVDMGGDALKVHNVDQFQYIFPLLASCTKNPNFEVFKILFDHSRKSLTIRDLGDLLLSVTSKFAVFPEQCELIIKYLLDKGAPVDYQSNMISSPLVNLVSQNVDPESLNNSVEVLIQAGADLFSAQPLLVGIITDNLTAVKCLVQNGANPNQKINVGKREFKDLCNEYNSVSQSNWPNLNVKIELFVPLFVFVRSFEMLNLLLDNGAKLDLFSSPQEGDTSSVQKDDIYIQNLWKSGYFWLFDIFYSMLLSPIIQTDVERRDHDMKTVENLNLSFRDLPPNMHKILAPVSLLFLAITRGMFSTAALLIDYGFSVNDTCHSVDLVHVEVFKSATSLVNESPPYFELDQQLSVLDVLVITSSYCDFPPAEVLELLEKVLQHPKTSPYTIEKALSLAVYHKSPLFDQIFNCSSCISKSRSWLIIPAISKFPCPPQIIAMYNQDYEILEILLAEGVPKFENFDLSEFAVARGDHKLISILGKYNVGFSEEAFYTCFDSNNVILATIVLEIIQSQLENRIIFTNFSADERDLVLSRMRVALHAMDAGVMSDRGKDRSSKRSGKRKKSPKKSSSPRTPLSLRLVPF
ncbi:hypothetical protein P9112_006414 [Eukaryota sp. TZLM1-RC]